MDSANSSSLQSSSGGDDDFDSRVDTLSAFFNSSSTAATALPPPQPPPPLSSSSDGHLFFDYSYLDSSTRLLPLGSSSTTAAAAPWSRPLISSSSNCTAAAATAPLGALPAAGSQPASSSSVQPLPDQPNAAAGAATAPRSSKKRARASRRAPTTVLTTDTSNFRAMVQEFTGIPSPPFAAASASPFGRSRFDLFHSAAAFRSSSADAAPPPFLLRPFPQKAQSPPSFAAISNPTSCSPPPTRPLSTVNNRGSNATTNIPTDNTNYRLHSHELGLGGGQSQPLVNLQNSILNFQSFLQPSLPQPKYSTLPAMAESFNAKPHGANELSGLPLGLIGSEAMRSSWTVGGADLAQMRPAAVRDYSGSQTRVGSSCKPNCSASAPSEFNGEKASESAAATRGEGMVESWIHSSD